MVYDDLRDRSIRGPQKGHTMTVRWKVIAIVLFGLSYWVDASRVVAEEGTLELSIRDASSLKPIPARVRVRDDAGRDHIPAGATVVPIAHDRWFPATGPVRLRVPAGPVSIRVERGLEHRPVKETVTWRGHLREATS